MTLRNTHIDLGYAVTSYSSQGQTVDRVLVNANTQESKELLNERMAYVAVSRAREDARIYTNSTEGLGGALSREQDKEMAMVAVREAREGIDKKHISRIESDRQVGNNVEVRYARVTREDPCPVCHKTDNCSIVIKEKSQQ